VDAGDSGQLAIAGHFLGIAHPPGYPLWCLLAFAFSRALPFAEVVFRLNLLSALLGGACVGILFVVQFRRGVHGAIAAVVAIAVATAPTFWSQAIITEVYMLATALVAMLLLSLDHYDRRPCSWSATRVAVIMGLALAAHTSLIVVLPVVLWKLVSGARGSGSSLVVPLQGLWVGLSLYAIYLPSAAYAKPPLLWADTSTVSGWWAHVTRSEYGGYVWPGLEAVLSSISHYFVWVELQFTLPVLLIAAVGVFVASRTKQGRHDLLLLLASGPFLATALAGLLRGEQVHGVDVYYIPSSLIVGLLVGCGADWVYKRSVAVWRIPNSLRVATLLLLVGLSLWPLTERWIVQSRRGNWVAHDYAVAVLNDLPPGATLYAQGDFELFPLMYVQTIEGVRDDVIIRDAADDSGSRDVYGYTRDEPEGVVFASLPLGSLDRNAAPNGLTLRVGRAKGPPIQPPALERQPPARSRLDRWDRALLARYHLSQARYALSIGRRDVAESELGHGRSLAKDSERTLNNLATLAARHGLLDLAEEIWNEALLVDPSYRTARANLDQLQAARQTALLPDAAVSRSRETESATSRF